MKNFALIIIVIMFSLKSFGQKSYLSPLHKEVDFQLPEQAVKVNKKAVASTSTVSQSNSDTNNSAETYNINDIVVSLYDVKKNVNADYLETTKKWMDEMYKGKKATNYSSETKTINNLRVLIVRYISLTGQGNYTFSCLNKEKTSVINGKIQFKQGDNEKALGIMTSILQSLKFKG